MLKKILLVIFFILGFCLAFLVTRTTFSSYEAPTVEAVSPIVVDDIAVERFSQSIAFKTISYIEPEKLDTAAFEGFHQFLAEAYPTVEAKLEKQLFNYTLLYKWAGSDPSAKSVVMMGHFDVVPVDESTMDKWEALPFSGEIKNGNVYGRGTMDDKINVIAWMEVAEILLKEGFQPKQNIYFSFGHDEEVGGERGAKLVANYLKEQGEKIAFVIDEGGFIAEDMVPDLQQPVAMINTGEKGFVSFKLTLQGEGGHSSSPPKDNTIGSLARAIVKLEDNQFPYRKIPVIDRQFEIMGAAFESFTTRMAFANSWLFGQPLLEAMNAHTTTAPTMLSGGVKDNVIPTEASVVVNFRIMPGETVEDIRAHIIKVVDDDRISLETISNVNEPSPISDYESASYKLIEKTILQLFPSTVVSPGLLGGGTDSKHFIPVAEQVYRFYPTRITPSNFSGFHGNNEHISVENYKETIQFNYQLLKNLQL